MLTIKKDYQEHKKLYHLIPKETFEKHNWLENPTIFTASTRWWISGLVDYSLKAKKEFLILDHDPRNYAFFTNPHTLLGKDAVFVNLEDYQTNIEENAMPFLTRSS